MTFSTHSKIARGRVDPAPMVDVVFLLLIFLTLSSPLVLQPGIGVVELSETQMPHRAAFHGLVVTVTRDNLMFFNQQPATLEQLPRLLRAAAHQTRSQELIIKADKQVSQGVVMQIMNIAFESGITAVLLAERPAPGAPLPPTQP
jgi:biopolymer transport protein ExbD